MRQILAILFLMFVVPVRADEMPIPAFSKPPVRYLHPHENCVGVPGETEGSGWECATVNDELLVGNVLSEKLTFWLQTIGINNHLCYLTGEAKSVGAGMYEYLEKSCRFTLNVTGSSAQVEDVGDQCRQYHCGSRGGIGKIQFTAESK